MEDSSVIHLPLSFLFTREETMLLSGLDPFLGSVPHECNLDECSSLAFGLINNNINSNYCDRLINSFKMLHSVKRHEQICSGDHNFGRIVVDIISNLVSPNMTEIIKNFSPYYFTLFYYSDCASSSFLFPKTGFLCVILL